MTSWRVERTPSRSGPPTVRVDGIPYHSAYDPRREAERFYAAYQIENADIILHFGWGLGYAATPLRSRAKRTARIVVFEPDTELFEASRPEPGTQAALADARFRFVLGREVDTFFEDWGLGACSDTDRILWIEWPTAANASAVRAHLDAHLRDRAANLLTHFRNGELYFRNVIRNFQFQSSADVGGLFGKFSGAPLVLVSAGPSLDLNAEVLREAQDRCFILAVDTALRPLLAAGVVPHAIIAADPSELNARHIAGVVPGGTYLIAEQAVHPTALESAPDRFLFGLGLFPDSLFAKFGFGRSRLDAWGSVATTALDLACRSGASPVIFAGQDFAYSWGRDYASHTIHHGNTFVATQAPTVMSRDIFGNEIHTTPNLVAYRDYFVRRMKQSPRVRFINATEGGILKAGCEILPLRDALRGLPAFDASAILQSFDRPLRPNPEALVHLKRALETRDPSCSCFKEFVDLAAREALLTKSEEEIDRRVRGAIQLLAAALNGCSSSGSVL